MAEEDFGAGLETPPNGAPNGQQQTPPVVETPPSRALVEQMKGLGLEAPDDWNDTSLIDNLLAMQDRANKAAEYENQIRAFEEQQAKAAADAAAALAAQKTADSAAQQVAKRKYERVSLDQDALNFVERDPVNGGFRPKDPRSGLHVQAAQVVNEAISRRSKVSNDIVDDPYGTAAELVAPVLEEFNRQWEEKYKALEARISPAEKQMAEIERSSEERRFATQHGAKLFVENSNEFTPLGAAVAEMYADGVPLEKALAYAEKAQGHVPKVEPKKSISKVQTPAPAPEDRRFIRGLRTDRTPANAPDSGAPPTGRMATFNDFFAKYPTARPGKRSN
jgi:hypothetical protein